MNAPSIGPSSVYRSQSGRAAVLAAYRAQAARIPFPFESRYVPTAVGDTHVLIAGPERCPPLVVLSGVHFGAFFTAEWVRRLVPAFRVLIPDIVGQPNLSTEFRPRPLRHEYARWLAEVLDRLELERAPMLGISFGGAVVLDLAAYAPTRLSKAALLVPGGFGASFAVILKIMRTLFVPWTAYRLVPRPAQVPALVSPLGDNLPDHWYEFFELLFRHVYWNVRPPGPFSAADFASYSAPTLAIFARDDCFFPGEHAARAAAAALGPSLNACVIEGKHIPTSAAIDAAIDRVAAFFGVGITSGESARR
jgi:pimeloyl-ACP methyl ester carboxylesterase